MQFKTGRNAMNKRLIWVMLVLSSIGSLWAADPFTGTWKMDVAKSKFLAGREVKELTMTVAEQADIGVVTAKGTNGEGKPISVKYTVPFKGGTLAYSEGGPPAGTTVVAKRVDRNTVEFNVTMNGKQVASDRAVLSPDRNTITLTRQSVDATGKPVQGTEVYDRQ
jgi:hypothetical protein